jgi:chromatin modification-related protein EAF6
MKKELEERESNLNSLTTAKKNIERKLLSIESHLFSLEIAYLNETTFGNLVKGFDGYISRHERKRGRINEGDRIFSSSSVGFKPILKVSDDEFTWDSDDSEEYNDSKRVKKKRRKLSVESDDDF